VVEAAYHRTTVREAKARRQQEVVEVIEDEQLGE
jgi:hypothetical protein